jgi:hypothetical protein
MGTVEHRFRNSSIPRLFMLHFALFVLSLGVLSGLACSLHLKRMVIRDLLYCFLMGGNDDDRTG